MRVSCVKSSGGALPRPSRFPILDWVAPFVQILSIITLELFIPDSVRHFGPVIIFEARRVLPRGLVYVEDKHPLGC